MGEMTHDVRDSQLDRWATYMACRLEREYVDAEAANEIGDMHLIGELLDGWERYTDSNGKEGPGPVEFIDRAVEFLAKFEEM